MPIGGNVAPQAVGMLHRKRWGCCTDTLKEIHMNHDVRFYSGSHNPIITPPKPYNPLTNYNPKAGPNLHRGTPEVTINNLDQRPNEKPLWHGYQRGLKDFPISQNALLSKAHVFSASHNDVV